MQKRKTSCFFAIMMAVGLGLLLACSRDERMMVELPGGNPLELESRLEQVESGSPCTIEAMASNDVIVAVNGYPYRRQTFDAQVNLLAQKMMRQKSADAQTVYNVLSVRKQQLPRDFVMKRLMIDHAFEEKVITVEELKKLVAQHVAEMAKRANKTGEEVLAKMGGNRKDYLYEVAERIVIDRLVGERIPPVVKVDDDFVAKVQKQVEEENAAAQATNESYRAQLAGWKRDIEAGKVTFEALAAKHAQAYNGNAPAKDGYWGEFEKGFMDSRKIDREVFKMLRDQISDPLEDDNGFHLIKVLEVKPPVKNEKGRIIERESRKLAHIYIEKEPLVIRQTDPEMFKDLKVQMQMQAVNFYVESLRTNGVNKVVYPHGEVLFR